MHRFLPLLLLIPTIASPAASPAQAAPTQVTPAQATVGASAAAPPAPAPNDYSNPEYWLCLPGRQDACAVDLATTVIAADGSMTPEAWTASTDPKVDCFYVYPTVSLEPTISSDMTQGPAEKAVVRTQFARFGQVCRQFAPMYRQVTMLGLLARMGGRPIPQAQALAYSDVADAWHYYLQHDNHGRGVILIGHSQGGNLLRQLVQKEIDGKPIESPLLWPRWWELRWPFPGMRTWAEASRTCRCAGLRCKRAALSPLNHFPQIIRRPREAFLEKPVATT